MHTRYFTIPRHPAHKGGTFVRRQMQRLYEAHSEDSPRLPSAERCLHLTPEIHEGESEAYGEFFQSIGRRRTEYEDGGRGGGGTQDGPVLQDLKALPEFDKPKAAGAGMRFIFLRSHPRKRRS